MRAVCKVEATGIENTITAKDGLHLGLLASIGNVDIRRRVGLICVARN